ncbi:MAG TPA: type II toxin-antitoxin system RelE/ParE family toxin [Rubrivivax sp.]|nr:type II toxin-antitoxin system RelE/ParE family toxin [Rubrivivax sp.]
MFADPPSIGAMTARVPTQTIDAAPGGAVPRSASLASCCFLAGKRVAVVHAFTKKTQQTPDKESKIARKRVKELQDA